MTKLKQQFAAAGIVGTSTDRPVRTRKGWTYHAQKSYVRGRFDSVQPLRNQFVFNHKVEQVARALVLDFEGSFGSLHTTSPVRNSIHFGFEPQTAIKIGKLTRRGATLLPDKNTALALLGLNGAAVLHHLGSMRVVDELTGAIGEVIVNDGEFIYSSVGVLLNLAQDCVKSPSAILNNYKGNQRVRKSK